MGASGRETLASLPSATGQDRLSALATHPDEEAMGLLALPIIRLKGTLHLSSTRSRSAKAGMLGTASGNCQAAPRCRPDGRIVSILD